MKLEIIKGLEYNADFTVVSDDGLTPQVLDPTDTATFSLSTKGHDSECVLSNVSMTLKDEDTGLFSLTLTPEQTALLNTEIGFAEDKYPTRSNYNGSLDFKLTSGNRTASVDMYVKDIGTCQA